VREWRQQFQKLESVNLRYDNQVIVNPDMEGKPRQAALAPGAAKVAAAAGVKQAALVTRIGPHEKALPKPVFELSPKKLDPKGAAAKKPAAKAKAKKPSKPPIKTATAKPAAKTPAATAKSPRPNTTPANAGAKKPAQTVPVATRSPAIAKPSPAIVKQQANASAN
jgi:hypothetical protein